jgi:hypothetical protein
MEITQAVTINDLAEIRSIFQEYFDFILHDQHIDMGYQVFQAENGWASRRLCSPQGCLLMVWVEGKAAGVASTPAEEYR